MRVYNDAEGLEHIYYIHEDNLGSIQAITDESRNVVSRYYYTPWGGRELLAGRNITDRGYTFHEYLEPFGLINMNGRVYDPVLARFLSPDPYVQAPDYTQGFNRYAYCYNNPFKYTDPSGELQIGPFYISLNVGWGYGSGFYFGISAGVGIEGGAYAGISIGYNTSGSFSFSASAGIAGFYVSGGYDTKGGWNASAGWSAPLPSFGIVSFNTNMLGVSGSYSQNGGWSYNHMGVQINKSGMSFSPSVGVSTVLYGVEYSAVNIALGYEETGEQFKNNEELHAQINAEIGDVETIQNDLNTTIVLATHYGVNGLFGSKGYYLKSNDGMLYGQGGRVGGTTKHVWGLITGNHSKIFISPGVKGISENGKNVLQSTVVHEMIHAYHINMFHNGKMTGKQYTQYSEAVAYSYSLAYYKLHGMPYFTMKAGEQLNSMNVRAYPKSIDYTPLSKYKIW